MKKLYKALPVLARLKNARVRYIAVYNGINFNGNDSFIVFDPHVQI
jgi:hypothetical protein